MHLIFVSFTSHYRQRLEAARLASQGISLPSVLTSEFGFSPTEKASTELWLTRVTADSAEFQGNASLGHLSTLTTLADTVDRLKVLIAKVESGAIT